MAQHGAISESSIAQYGEKWRNPLCPNCVTFEYKSPNLFFGSSRPLGLV